jgi:hypothetical protein
LRPPGGDVCTMGTRQRHRRQGRVDMLGPRRRGRGLWVVRGRLRQRLSRHARVEAGGHRHELAHLAVVPSDAGVWKSVGSGTVPATR